METTTDITKPRIYVACLAAYNNGYLHGAWIDASNGEWAMWDGIAAMLRASPVADAEEWAIHDYEGFGEVRIPEYTSIGTVAHIAAFAVEHGALGLAVLAHFDGDFEEARAALEGRYQGSYDSLRDYMQGVIEEGGDIPDALRHYIDWDAMARDAEMSGDLFTIETDFAEVHVFSGH